LKPGRGGAEWFHGTKLTKQGFDGVATTRVQVKKVVFLIGRWSSIEQKGDSPRKGQSDTIGKLLVQN
jgi:hypothetical protein